MLPIFLLFALPVLVLSVLPEILLSVFWARTSLLVMIFAWLRALLEIISAFWTVKLSRHPWFLILFPLAFFLFAALLWSGRLWAFKYRGHAYERENKVYNQAARCIGKVLCFVGGEELMVGVANAIYRFDHDAFYELEWCWYGIGSWMP